MNTLDRCSFRFRRNPSRAGALPLLVVVLSAQDDAHRLGRRLHRRAGQARRGDLLRALRPLPRTQAAGRQRGAGALTGPMFNGNWNGVPLGQMLDRVRATMPLDKPATLSRQQTADVLTYIFSFNKIPAGKAELPRQAEMLNLIQFKAPKH